MTQKHIIHTENAPAAIGAYSQAVRAGNTLYLSGQIPLDPQTMQLIGDDIEEQIHQVFRNLLAVVKAAGGTADQIMQLRIYLTDLKHFALVNTIMAEYIGQPYPARAAIQVSALPKNAQIEVEGTAVF